MQGKREAGRHHYEKGGRPYFEHQCEIQAATCNLATNQANLVRLGTINFDVSASYIQNPTVPISGYGLQEGSGLCRSRWCGSDQLSVMREPARYQAYLHT